MSGAISDAGTLSSKRRVAGGRLELTQALTGRSGVIRLRASRSCTSPAGTWRLLSGTSGYAGLTGGGRAAGLPRCAAAPYPVRITYSGSVRTPTPPPLAQPGSFGGSTSQREEVTLTVDTAGRALSALQLRVMTPCTGTPITTTAFIRVLTPQAIGADKAFSASSAQGSWTVTGRFTTPTTVEGSATAAATVTSGGITYSCAATVTWRASQPSPAATPGTYCGFTTQGSSICFDVAASGREVSRLEVGVVVLCNGRTVEVEVRVEFTAIPIGGNLGFRKSASAFEGLVSGTGFVSGLLGEGGGAGASGSVGMQLPVFDHEGTRYSCGVGSARWEARPQ